jgi:hydroxymethylpyrimidine pyrophosphatase-like HAD family hydrolase
MLAKIKNHVERKTEARWISVEGDAAGIVASSIGEMDEILEVIEGLSAHSDLTYERNTVYLRFSHRAYRKGSCLQEAADRWGLEADKILAVGDNHNDLSMLQPEICEACGCPSNAIPEVRDYVQKRGGKVANNPGSVGVIEVMKHYFDQ